MLKSLLPVLGFLLLAMQIFAQDQVLEKTNTAELNRMYEEFTQREMETRKRIEKYAAEKGILIDHYLPNGKVMSLVGFDETGAPLYRRTDNAQASATIATKQVYPSATLASKYNLAGRGFIVGEWDGGTSRLTHREFEGRSIQIDNGTMAVSEHATHVGGTLVAGGINPSARGMAYQATLWTNDWNNDDAEMTLRASQGLLISNHSYGTNAGWDCDAGPCQWYGSDAISTMYDYKFGFYDSQARDWDRLAYNAPFYLIVKSAGNSRNAGPGNNPSRPNNGPYDCIPTYSVAKNILTVGAVNGNSAGYSGPNSVAMSDFSSWGPADDGRIKPDIVGDGVGVFSTGSANDQQYITLQGTSMSAPSVAGSCLLLQEMFSNTHKKAKMWSSTLKGLVIHTADETGFFLGPDYRFGWGQMNTKKASDVILGDSISSLIKEEQLLNQATREITVTAKGTEPLVATLCWTDVQGAPGPAALNSRLKMLVNDLDLRLVNQANQSITLPWRCNPDSVTSPARKNDNSVDNVEKIELPNPTVGQAYKLRITHKGNLQAGPGLPLAQNYSLIVSGIVAGDTSQVCIPLQYMNSKTGIVGDGSGARDYVHNADCGWVLNPEDTGSIVQAVFRSFNVAAGDTLYAYSGTSASGTLIGKFSGSSLPDTLLSTTPQLYLNFKTNGSNAAPGWEISYSSIAKPKYTFSPDASTICTGNSVVYSIVAQNGPTTDWTYSWQFPGGNPSTSTLASPTVVYTDLGTYNATVSVTNKAGAATQTKNAVVIVKPLTAPNTIPYFEGFESTTFPNNSNPDLVWTIQADVNPWVRNTLSPFAGLGAMRIRNNTGKKDKRELISPAFSLENVPAENRYITFRMAYARINTAASADQLRVLISTNCGKTWTEAWKRSNTTNPKLSTIGDGTADVVTGSFIPEPNQYRKDSISLASLPADTKNLIVKFEMTSETGNFLYLDNFWISQNVTGIEEVRQSVKMDMILYPNPSDMEARLMIKSPGSKPVRIELRDIAGRTIAVKDIQAFNLFETAEFSVGEAFQTVGPGVYFIHAQSVSAEKTIKWLRK
jgi:hypothetical protein